MDVSCNSLPEGEELIQTIVTLTGLPESDVRDELSEIMRLQGGSETTMSGLSLDQLRRAMLVYLESIHADMVQEEQDCVTIPPL